jgi:hypothetical protein
MLQKALADASISKSFVADMNRFAQEFGILTGDVPYENVVATQFRYLWRPKARYFFNQARSG